MLWCFSEDKMDVDVGTTKESEEKDSASKAPTEEDDLTKAVSISSDVSRKCVEMGSLDLLLS